MGIIEKVKCEGHKSHYFFITCPVNNILFNLSFQSVVSDVNQLYKKRHCGLHFHFVKLLSWNIILLRYNDIFNLFFRSPHKNRKLSNRFVFDETL